MSGIFVLNSAMPTLIPWAFTSTLLILAVLTVRWLTRNRLSSVNRYALWAVVLIRLLIPIQLPFLSSLGAVDFAPQMEDTPVYAFPTDHIDAPESYIQHIWEEQGEDPVMSAGITSRGFPALGGLGFDYYSGARAARGRWRPPSPDRPSARRSRRSCSRPRPHPCRG